MKTLRNLGLVGLVGLLGLAGAYGGEDRIVQSNEGVKIQSHCKVENDNPTGTTALEVNILDTNGDGNYDEAFVTKGYYNVNMFSIQGDNAIAKATTHYVASGIAPDKQFPTVFPDTRVMTPEYRKALKLVCNGE